MIEGENHNILWKIKMRKKDHHMKTITKEYALLFNTITDMEKALQALRQELILVQQQAEELFLEEGE